MIKESMHDPDSVEIDTTWIAPVNDGIHYIQVEFRAKNQFNATMRHIADGWIDHDTCEALLLNAIEFKQ